MRYIGLKNFRRFEYLEPLVMSPITILVGGNNSGKSTVVKGILSILSFMKDSCDYDYSDESINNDEQNERGYNDVWISHNQRFRFNKDVYTHIGTSKRALYANASSKEITFMYGIGNCNYELTVTMDDEKEDSTSGRISRINVAFLTELIDVSLDLFNWKASISFHTDNPEKYKINAEQQGLNTLRRSRYTQLYNYFNSFNEEISISIKLPEKITSLFRDFDPSIILSLFECIEDTINKSLEEATNKNLDETDKIRFFRRNVGKIDFDENTIKFLNNYISLLTSPRKSFHLPYIRRVSEVFEYVYAHAVTQSVIYSAKDINDYLVKTVHDFANCGISKSSRGRENRTIYNFITDWMKQFNIGVDYIITPIGGEAYVVTIKKPDGGEGYLADLGMGSIQLMILLFRIGTVLNHHKATTIILEEPEQNLHPMLQSKLADFVYYIYRKFKIRFLLETHSEYLIRRTQVLVGNNFDSEEKLKDNPFKVYYFPSSGKPYDMEYTTSGKFAQPFGPGFFDEASNLHMSVLRNARKQ